ncbi:MAG: TIGR00159 family protein [Ruminococcaceae bacterium]|nr:TIGR00159 family protein [Oscillospiraceae bacterium]
MMSTIETLFQQMAKMQWSDYLDIAIVAYLLYRLLPLVRNTGTKQIAKAIGVILAVAWLTDLMNLYALSFIMEQFLQIGLIALVVLFQPELRRMLDHLGNMKFHKFLGVEKAGQEMAPIISQTVAACEVMSRERVGALIVFARDNRLDEYIKTGTKIEAQISEQLIRNIFFPKASLHDGAVIVRDGRMAAAGCVLPLSTTERLSADLGTRHRAGVGISEVSDAVVVIVSEETGTISVAVGGMLKRHLASQTLERLLTHELCPEENSTPENPVQRLKQKLQKIGKEERK